MATTAPSPPHDSSSPLSSVDHSLSRYARLLVEKYEENEPASQTKKILFAFLDHLPPDGLCNVAQDIIDNPDLSALADHYISTVLVPIRANGGKTPSGLSTSRFGDLNDVEDISTEIVNQKRNQALLKAQCLARDNNRCILSGLYDLKMARKLSGAERQTVLTSGTEAAHIVPFSLASFTERDRHVKAISWGAIYHVFPSIRSFSTDKINDPSNVLTLATMLHDAFGSFNLCLELTETANRYNIKKYPDFPTAFNIYLPRDSVITFTAHDGRYPLPDENLLAVHASVGAILHASGMAEVIEHILEDRDETPCLATDGSTPIEVLLMAC